MNHVHEQHTTPKCYLKNFSDDGSFIYRKFKSVNKFDKPNLDLKKPISLKSATTVNNFYTVKKGREPMMVETYMYSKEIENHYPRIYNLLINPEVNVLKSMQERTDFLLCTLSLHCRTPKQFNLFFQSIPEKFIDKIDSIKEDYKAAHLGKTLTNFVAAHQYKVIRVAKITDDSEFITSDNPVLIINPNGRLKNDDFREQFNNDNKIIIPIDNKHCCILVNANDKNGISVTNKVFCNEIERINVNSNFVEIVNNLMLESGDKYYFGKEIFMKRLFGTFKDL